MKMPGSPENTGFTGIQELSEIRKKHLPVSQRDIYSKRKIFPEEFKEAQEYTIYYDKLTKIIVKVDMVE